LIGRAHEHDDAVVKRANRAVWLLIGLVSLLLGAAATLVLDSLLSTLVLGPMAVAAVVLVVGPWAQIRLWYLPWIRPAFRDTAVRSVTPSSL
jgi:hypothetical protein